MRRKRRFSKEAEEALRKQSPPPGRGRARVGVVERGQLAGSHPLTAGRLVRGVCIDITERRRADERCRVRRRR